jgi:hypothetical protein
VAIVNTVTCGKCGAQSINVYERGGALLCTTCYGYPPQRRSSAQLTPGPLPDDPKVSVVKPVKPPTGVKFDGGKPPLALLPTLALEAVGRVLAFGAKKYQAHNWRGGIQYSRLAGATLRHVFAFLRGEDKDPETGESHLAHAACCVLFALEFVEEGRPELDDRHKPTAVIGGSK